MAAVQSMRCDFGLRFSLRAILMLLSIEWTRGCMPRATQWRLEISQEYNSWEAYVYEFIAYEGTQGLNLTYSGDNCTRPGYETSNSGALAFDGDSSTSWQTCVYKIGGWVSFNLAAPAAVTNLCANQYDGGHGNTVKAFHVQYWVNGNWVLAWDTGAVGDMGPGSVCLTSPVAACPLSPPVSPSPPRLPHAPPPPPLAPGSLCAETCIGASDGLCDDGGPGAEYTACQYGTDCADCGVRRSTVLDPSQSPDPTPSPSPDPSPSLDPGPGPAPPPPPPPPHRRHRTRRRPCRRLTSLARPLSGASALPFGW